MRSILILLLGLLTFASTLSAQTITVSTVTRAPFSMPDGDAHVGFSVDLMTEAASRIGRDVEWLRMDSFSQMLDAVQNGQADAAIANISITSQREAIMDFSQPMFDSGIQIMLTPDPSTGSSLLSALLRPELGLLVLAALGILFGAGMLMWVFERRKQPYFDKSAGESAFPAFWWALNLVVNGGFEERVPQSRMGRFFAVILVISSLFFVSIFVANITAALTVNAISDQLDGINDLDNRKVGTIEGSTSQALLNLRGIDHRGLADTDAMFAAFESGQIDAVVFDSPILAYYASAVNPKGARIFDRVYRRENYGIAYPTGSALREELDQVLLTMREDGTFNTLREVWFGSAYSDG